MFAVVAIGKEKRPGCLFFFRIQKQQKSKQRNLAYLIFKFGFSHLLIQQNKHSCQDIFI
jgi:hypothetical protein